MRILANVDSFAPLGGVELSTLQVCAELARRGHQIDVLYAHDGGLREQWESFAHRIDRVPGFTVEFARPWRHLHVLPGSVRAGVRAHPDVIYLNRSEQLLWGALTSRLAKAPLVCHLRHHPFSARAVGLVRRSAQRYVAVSRYIRDEWVQAGLPADRVEVVHNGVSLSAYPMMSDADRAAARQMLRIAPGSRVFLHYGRLTADKGTAVLLDAWQRAEVPGHWLLLLVGDATPEIEAAVHRMDRRDIRILPRSDDVSTLLAAADVTVLPARWQEPFGRVVVESMAAGVPMVASRVGGIPEILDGTFARMLIDPDDPAGLAGTMRRMGDWRTTEPQLGESARRHVGERFALDGTVDGIERILESVRRDAASRVPNTQKNAVR